MASSKVIVYGVELQAALKAALAVAPNSDYDVVQLRVQASGGNLLVCARDPKNNLMVGITVGTTMVDIVHDRDEVIEISKASVVQILAKKVKADGDEEDPLVGLIIAEDKVTCTDETGFDLGIRLTRVRRVWFDGGNPYLGDVEAMLARAADSLPDEAAYLSPIQWKKIAAVANATGTDLAVHPLENPNGGMSRVLITGDRVAGYASHMPRAEEPEPSELPVDSEDGATRVVPAAPPRGIA